MLAEARPIERITDEGDFCALIEQRLRSGQHELARAMRVLTAHAQPEIGAALSDVADDVFLEPLLFSYFAGAPHGTQLGQLLLGGVPRERWPECLEVLADPHGTFYLPGLGSFTTDRPRAQALLRITPARGHFQLEHEGALIPFGFQPITRVAGTRSELVTHVSPLLATRFVDTSGEPASATIDPQLARRGRELARALQWLSACVSGYAALIRDTTRQVCVFHAPRVNSFASINAHGTAFFNTRELDPASPDDTVFFYDELAHQCGHIIFNAVTVRRGDFLAVDPETSLRSVAPDEQDARTIYDALHGLYTEHMMSTCMLQLEQRALVQTARQAHELRGRLSFIVHKYCVDLANLAHARLFTPLGRSLYEYLRVSCLALLRARPDLMSLDMEGQPYNFDYARFAAQNPMPCAGPR